MNGLKSGMQISLTVHAFILGIIIVVGGSPIMRGRPMVVDLTIEPPAGAAAPANGKKSSGGHPPGRRTAEASIAMRKPPVTRKTRMAHEQPEPGPVPPVSGERAPVSGPVAPLESAGLSAPAAVAAQGGVPGHLQHGASPVTAGTGHTPGAGNPAGAEEAYIRENFAYIRDIIMKNLSYPRIAREMGLSGRVVVSFIVRRNGDVEDIRILEGSGCAILDKRAVETIKKVCPLPRPPAKAQLKVPIIYRLE
ncbi:MAG: energy transducer TonB [Nitrospiraceae bacterium]|nr:energy transducer TonB [Nitrospiraceae bacterium]